MIVDHEERAECISGVYLASFLASSDMAMYDDYLGVRWVCRDDHWNESGAGTMIVDALDATSGAVVHRLKVTLEDVEAA